MVMAQKRGRCDLRGTPLLADRGGGVGVANLPSIGPPNPDPRYLSSAVYLGWNQFEKSKKKNPPEIERLFCNLAMGEPSLLPPPASAAPASFDFMQCQSKPLRYKA